MSVISHWPALGRLVALVVGLGLELGPALAQLPTAGRAAATTTAETTAKTTAKTTAQAPADALGLQALATAHQICAVSVATLLHGLIDQVHSATGCAGSPLPDGQTVFQAASLGKPVFAFAVLQLAAQGRIDLDAPLLRYLPQGYVHLQNPFASRQAPRTDRVTAPELAAVTARQVLSHSSGLPNWSNQALRFDFAPGTGWLYSGEGFVLLQRAVEAITGLGLEALMQAQVFGPLGMRHSSYVWQRPVPAGALPATSAPADGQAAGQTQLALDAPIAAATLLTSAADYARFMAALLADPALLALTLHTPVAVDLPLHLRWGLGWGIEGGGDAAMLWHWGSNPGYRAFVMLSATSGDGLVMFSNSDRGLALAAPLVQAVLPGAHPVFESDLLPGRWRQGLCKALGWCF